MNIRFIAPRQELRSYVRSMWIVESPNGMPQSDVSLAAPNGCPRIVILVENHIVSVVQGKEQGSTEGEIYFAGNRDCPVIIRTPQNKTCFIGIEFHPHRAYAIFGIPMGETANRLLTIGDILSSWDRAARDRFVELNSLAEKISFIQHILIRSLLSKNIHNRYVDYCVSVMKTTDGLISLGDLEKKTGYSRRYLELLFKDFVGFSPKVLASIFRFQKFYGKWARSVSFDQLKDDLYEYYYDQAHFSKEFKRMTGFSPREYTSGIANEFGRRLTLH